MQGQTMAMASKQFRFLMNILACQGLVLDAVTGNSCLPRFFGKLFAEEKHVLKPISLRQT